MDINEFYNRLTEYSLDSDNYKKWREIHGSAFGNTFLNAFSDNPEAQIHLTAALINISQRKFDDAMPKLNLLKQFCCNVYDDAALNYFIGLNYEFLGDETHMTIHYDAVLSSNIDFLYNQSFHPYYRTAKFAQRDSECSKAIYYYNKALEFYKDTEIDSERAKIVSFINYDIATVYLYAHKYDIAKDFLDVSFKYDSTLNGHRVYVLAILYAVQGKEKEMKSLLDSLSEFLRANCEPMTSAIINGTDLHYFAVPQKDISYSNFWEKFLSDKERLSRLIEDGDIKNVENIISNLLTDTFYGFMKRNLECRVENDNYNIVVKCKNYCVKTLHAEYERLFKNNCSSWHFVSVDEFENYSF